MTLRIKTIEYALPMITSSISTGTTYTNSSNMTIYIPETNSRTFVSVALEVFWHDTVGGNVELVGYSIRGSCNSGTNWTTITSSSTTGTSSSVISSNLVVDMTNEFVSRFGSGAVGTFRWGFYANYAQSTTITNVSAKLIITYTFDDTSQTTRIKTVRIPIESLSTRLSNTAQPVKQTNTSPNQIPKLIGVGGFLPENGIVIRQMFFELFTNFMPSASSITVAPVLKIDSNGTETVFGSSSVNSTYSRFQLKLLYDVTSMPADSAHELYARHNGSSGNFFLNLGGWLTVTYEYNASTTTTVLNSVFLTTGMPSVSLLGSSYSNQTLQTELFVQETDVSLKQSGVFISLFINEYVTSFFAKVGFQPSFTNYTTGLPFSNSSPQGTSLVMHRFDADSNGGSGFSLARGKNLLKVSNYLSTSYYAGGFSALFIVNYTSSVVGDPDSHNKTIYYLFNSSETSSSREVVVNSSSSKSGVSFLQDNIYFASCFGLEAVVSYHTAGGSPDAFYSLYCAVFPSISDIIASSFWHPVLQITTPSTITMSASITFSDVTHLFQRYKNAPLENRILTPYENKAYRRFSNVNSRVGFYWIITLHQITYNVTGTLSNFSGDGSGVTVKFYRVSDGKYLGSTTSTTGGSFSWTWYDNTEDIFAEARQSSTVLGRSDSGTP